MHFGWHIFIGICCLPDFIIPVCYTGKSELMGETIMKFDEELEQFVFEYHGLIFAWDEEPGEITWNR